MSDHEADDEEAGYRAFTELAETVKAANASFERISAEQGRATTEAASAIKEASNRVRGMIPPLLAGGGVLGLLVGVLVGVGGYWKGMADTRAVAEADGYRRAIDANAAASWANTPSGKLAFRLDQTGILQAIAHCTLSGYAVQFVSKDHPKVCFPGQHADGWDVPQ